MRVLRRKFSKEFKLAAVRRLETGASVAEISRACEVNPNVFQGTTPAGLCRPRS
jgi:transposase-like protein